MARGKHIKMAEVRRINSLLREGRTYAQIAREIGRSQAAVGRIARMQVPTRQTVTQAEETPDMAVTIVKSSMSNAEKLQLLGILWR